MNTVIARKRYDSSLVVGLFSLHIGDYVYAVLCERNDLITVPAGMPHWFDGGSGRIWFRFGCLVICRGWLPRLLGMILLGGFLVWRIDLYLV